MKCEGIPNFFESAKEKFCTPQHDGSKRIVKSIDYLIPIAISSQLPEYFSELEHMGDKPFDEAILD